MGWSDQNIIARLVIIEGTGDGLFVYDGPPAAGNLIVSAAAASGTDADGNDYDIGLEVQNGGQIITQGTAASIREYIAGGNPVKQWRSGYTSEQGPAGIFTQLINQGDADEYIQWWLFGPVVTGQADAAFIVMNSSQQNAGNNAFGSLGYQDTSGSPAGMLSWGPGGISAIGTVAAVEPGTGTVAVDAVTETWHDISLDSGWSQTAGFQTPQYRLTAQGDLQLKGRISHAALGAATAINSGTPLPSAYCPAAKAYYRNADANGAGLEMAPSGVLTAYPGGASPATADLTGIVALSS